jgi:magnesium-transporting ATPase (P-type)
MNKLIEEHVEEDLDKSAQTSRKLLVSKNNRRSFMNILDIDSFINNVEKDISNCMISVSGNAFTEIMNKRKNSKNNKDINKLVSLIETHGKIFFRMTAIQKIDLVKFYKENTDNVVAMVGDGSNDCGALLCSDSGIAISANDSSVNITAHFYCYKSDLSSVEIIIKLGRASFENTIIMLKFILIYAWLQTALLILNYRNKQEIISSQYLFMDCATVLVSGIFISKTESKINYVQNKPLLGCWNAKFILSFVGQSCIYIATLYLNYYWIFLNIIKPDLAPDYVCTENLPTIYESVILFNLVSDFSCFIAKYNDTKHFELLFKT